MDLIYALEERIGQPEMFYGREEELKYFLNWIDNIPRKLSKSIAILSRRKKGKTAIAERLYNIIYTQNRNIIPFYYEVMEKKYHLKEFSEDFYCSFMAQYIAFKAKLPKYIGRVLSYETLKKVAADNSLTHIYEVTKGTIYWTWMEYILSTFNSVNNVNAKKMVLFLASNGTTEFGIKEIIEKCNLNMKDDECELKLKMLEKGDLISRGSSAYFYRGLGDNLLSRVVRKEYGYLMDNFNTEIILKEDKNKDLKIIEEMQENGIMWTDKIKWSY